MSGYCVKGEHENCPDTGQDTYTCSCPCHIGPRDEEIDRLVREHFADGHDHIGGHCPRLTRP